jgi:hypothetical protein
MHYKESPCFVKFAATSVGIDGNYATMLIPVNGSYAVEIVIYMNDVKLVLREGVFQEQPKLTATVRPNLDAVTPL